MHDQVEQDHLRAQEIPDGARCAVDETGTNMNTP